MLRFGRFIARVRNARFLATGGMQIDLIVFICVIEKEENVLVFTSDILRDTSVV